MWTLFKRNPKPEFTPYEITKALHGLMDYTFGEVVFWKHLTPNERSFINPKMFRFLKDKKFTAQKK